MKKTAKKIASREVETAPAAPGLGELVRADLREFVLRTGLATLSAVPECVHRPIVNARIGAS
jgi:hypothetical protein